MTAAAARQVKAGTDSLAGQPRPHVSARLVSIAFGPPSGREFATTARHPNRRFASELLVPDGQNVGRLEVEPVPVSPQAFSVSRSCPFLSSQCRSPVWMRAEGKPLPAVGEAESNRRPSRPPRALRKGHIMNRVQFNRASRRRPRAWRDEGRQQAVAKGRLAIDRAGQSGEAGYIAF